MGRHTILSEFKLLLTSTPLQEYQFRRLKVYFIIVIGIICLWFSPLNQPNSIIIQIFPILLIDACLKLQASFVCSKFGGFMSCGLGITNASTLENYGCFLEKGKKKTINKCLKMWICWSIIAALLFCMSIVVPCFFFLPLGFIVWYHDRCPLLSGRVHCVIPKMVLFRLDALFPFVDDFESVE